MTDLEALKAWRSYVYGQIPEAYENNPADYKSDMVYEVWKPRFKKFRPPINKWFRWAYSIQRTKFYGVYPASCSFGGSDNEKSVEL